MSQSPSIVPEDDNRDVFLVLDDFGGRLGRAWRETNEETDRAAIIRGLLDSQYVNPVRIVVFNTGEGWSRDVSFEIAGELVERCAERGEIPACLRDILRRYQRTR
jgi:hypothetical protein